MGFLKKLKFWRKKNKGTDLKKRAEELEKKSDREWEQIVAILRGRQCEPEDLSAASDGEMDANQQTVKVHVEDIKVREHLLRETNEDESVKPTLQLAGSSAEPAPQRETRFEFARQHELQTELQQVKKLKEDKDPEINEIRLAVEDTVHMKHIMEVKDFVLSLKLKISNLKKDCQESKELQKKLQEKLQALRIINNELEKKYETLKDCDEEKEILVMWNLDLQKEVEQLKIANNNNNKYWETKMKDCEEEKNALLICNEELRKEMKAVQNLQLVDGSSEPQGRQCVTDTADDGKISLQKFKFIRRLGEWGIWNSGPREREDTRRTRKTVHYKGCKKTRHHLQQHLYDCG